MMEDGEEEREEEEGEEEKIKEEATDSRLGDGEVQGKSFA